MIVGHGDIASAIIDRPELIFFASGVSNSLEIRESEYEREWNLMDEIDLGSHVVYFSSLCIYYSNSLYAQHKKRMEKMVKVFKNYTIIRLGNIDWGSNPNTLINYLKAHPNAEIRNVYRHIVSKDEFQYWIRMIPLGVNDIMNIPGRMVWVPELVKEIRKTNSYGKT